MISKTVKRIERRNHFLMVCKLSARLYKSAYLRPIGQSVGLSYIQCL
jgi:hypothetical protein